MYNYNTNYHGQWRKLEDDFLCRCTTKDRILIEMHEIQVPMFGYVNQKLAEFAINKFMPFVTDGSVKPVHAALQATLACNTCGKQYEKTFGLKPKSPFKHNGKYAKYGYYERTQTVSE